jgi:hypothetical protein
VATRAQPKWFIGLFDNADNMLCDLSHVDNLSFSYGIGQPAACTFNMPLTHSASTYIEPTSTYVKAYRETSDGRVLRFYGPVWSDEIATGGAESLSVTAFSPMVYLGKRPTTITVTAQDRGAAIKAAIDAANSDNDTGIDTAGGTIATSSTITADYAEEQPTILDLINQYSEATDGCDVEIMPQEYSGGKIAYLNVHARQGSVNNDAIFAYGAGTLNNCASINRSRSAEFMANYVRALEGDATSIWQNATSIAAYRRLDAVLSLSGDKTLANMSARTQYYMETHDAPNKVAAYQIQAGVDAPRFWDEFELGDTVQVHLRVFKYDFNFDDASSLPLDYRKGIEFLVQQRVVGVTISVDGNGVELLSQIETRSQ